MIKNSSFFLFVVGCAFSVLLAEAASRCIDGLYRKNAVMLSSASTMIPKFRRPFLAFGFLICWELLLAKAGGPTFFPFPTSASPEAASPMGIAFLCLIPYVFLLLMITVTDWEQRLIFDDTTRPLAVLGLAQTIFVSYAAASYTPLLENLLAAVFGGFAFLILAYLTQGGVGGGDVKLIAALGLWLGPDRLLTVVCAGLFLGGLAALWLLLTRQKKRKDSFAYGPCFTIPAILSFLV